MPPPPLPPVTEARDRFSWKKEEAPDASGFALPIKHGVAPGGGGSKGVALPRMTTVTCGRDFSRIWLKHRDRGA